MERALTGFNTIHRKIIMKPQNPKWIIMLDGEEQGEGDNWKEAWKNAAIYDQLSKNPNPPSHIIHPESAISSRLSPLDMQIPRSDGLILGIGRRLAGAGPGGNCPPGCRSGVCADGVGGLIADE